MRIRRCRISLRHIAPLLVLALSPCGVRAAATAPPPGYPLNISAGTQSLTVPWYLGPADDRVNPAFTAGTERTLRAGERLWWYQTANIGFFQNYWWMTGLFIDTELGLGCALPYGFHTDVRMGIGYLHYFWRRKTLELEDGVYVEARDWGRPSAMVPLSFVVGYGGDPARPLAVAPFFSVQWTLQAPFIDEAPAMTHLFFFAGVRVEWWRVFPFDWR